KPAPTRKIHVQIEPAILDRKLAARHHPRRLQPKGQLEKIGVSHPPTIDSIPTDRSPSQPKKSVLPTLFSEEPFIGSDIRAKSHCCRFFTALAGRTTNFIFSPLHFSSRPSSNRSAGDSLKRAFIQVYFFFWQGGVLRYIQCTSKY